MLTRRLTHMAWLKAESITDLFSHMSGRSPFFLHLHGLCLGMAVSHSRHRLAMADRQGECTRLRSLVNMAQQTTYISLSSSLSPFIARSRTRATSLSRPPASSPWLSRCWRVLGRERARSSLFSLAGLWLNEHTLAGCACVGAIKLGAGS